MIWFALHLPIHSDDQCISVEPCAARESYDESYRLFFRQPELDSERGFVRLLLVFIGLEQILERGLEALPGVLVGHFLGAARLDVLVHQRRRGPVCVQSSIRHRGEDVAPEQRPLRARRAA